MNWDVIDSYPIYLFWIGYIMLVIDLKFGQ